VKTNFFKVTYPSGLVQHVWDDAKDAEAYIAKCSGLSVHLATEAGLKVEHIVEGVMEKIEGAPASAIPTGVASSAPAVAEAPAAEPPAPTPPTTASAAGTFSSEPAKE
jgi:hypothetical protein